MLNWFECKRLVMRQNVCWHAILLIWVRSLSYGLMKNTHMSQIQLDMTCKNYKKQEWTWLVLCKSMTSWRLCISVLCMNSYEFLTKFCILYRIWGPVWTCFSYSCEYFSHWSGKKSFVRFQKGTTQADSATIWFPEHGAPERGIYDFFKCPFWFLELLRSLDLILNLYRKDLSISTFIHKKIPKKWSRF